MSRISISAFLLILLWPHAHAAEGPGAVAVAAPVATPVACPLFLGGDPAALEPTGWRSVFGTYGLLEVSGVFEAKDGGDRKYYVFESKTGHSRVFAALDRKYKDTKHYLKAYGDGGGMGIRTIYDLTLREVTDAGALARPDLGVTVEVENDGFRIERWTFSLDGREQNLNFYDREQERRHIAAKTKAREAEEQRLRDNPDPGSRQGIRKAIVDGIVAQGLDPVRCMWIDEEVERQWAEMWHDITR